MKILILGGTGAMGSHLVKILSAENNTVFVTSRKKKESSEKIKYIEGNAHDISFLDSILKERFDCIVDFMIYETDEFKGRVQKFLSSCSQYVFLSSSRVYAQSALPLTEDSPRLLDASTDREYLLTDEYALTKARQENVLFESKSRNWTIIRPYITYSENRLQLGVMEKEDWLFLALYGNALVFSKDISVHTTTLTYGYDVSRGIAAIIGKEKALGEAFHITGNDCSIKWSRVLEVYREVLEENGMAPAVYEAELCHRLKNPGGKYQVLYDRYFDRVFDNSKISGFIDTATFLKPEEGLSRCLEDFLRRKDFLYTGISDFVSDSIKNYKIRIPLSKINGTKQKVKYILSRLGILEKIR